MKEKTLYMIGNAHIDPVWLWQWQEGFHEVKATFRSALDRMNEYPEFTFVSSSAAYYEWVEHNDPEMFAEIRRRVSEGRWRIVGGWWIQPDCNIPGGESFVRQALYAQRYFKEKLGVTAQVGYNVDSFGHNGMLPQILSKSGLKYYIFMRPMPHEKGLPGRLFWWESDDGSRVLAFRIPFEYGTWGKDIEAHVQRCQAELKHPFDATLCFYGVGNHGGGPTKENIESILQMDASPDFPRLVFSTPEELFTRVQTQKLPIPVVHDDLQHHASGCYSVHSGIKRWNRKAENALLAAEKFAALAFWTTGQPYPGDFTHAWKNVLFNQFHDIMAGTSLEEAYEDARDLYGEALSIARRGLNNALQSLSWKIRIPQEDGATPIVAFNPHVWKGRLPVEMEFSRLQGTEVLLDDAGKQIPFQVVQSHSSASGRSRLSFVADLPSLGYRAYRLIKSELRPDLKPEKGLQPLQATDIWIENKRFRLEFQPDGMIQSLYDKQTGVQVFAGPAAQPVVIKDDSDTWSHNVFEYNQVEGCFLAKSIRLVECGDVRGVIRVTSEYGLSRLIQDFIVYRDLDQIDVRVTVDWHEQFKMLKLRFPVNISHMNATGEIPYGHKVRFASGEEEPGQSWVDLSGFSRDNGAWYGLSILNDGKYSYDVRVREIGLTVLRSPIYAHHIPYVPDPAGEYCFIDQGVQHFQYTLLPHDGSWEDGGTVRRAAELNQPPVALVETYHPDGALPQSDSFLSVDCDNILVSVVKKAEDDDSLVLRCVEMHKDAVHAAIRLPKWDRAIEADFGPCEIKTFRVPKDPQQPVEEVNLLEWSDQVE